ncbi:MAG: alpha/beta hydrolase [Helicobacteraceae bacterium]|jgi:fermentation-respiration switch protein FrsA (DUF1100 family)|nr:alpha/beta hydrolase [Helicobacteraceae bacterium]
MRLLFLSTISFSFFGCASLFFHPNKEVRFTPEFFELDYESRRITTSDGETLFAWLLKAKNPKALIVFLHGNAGNISEHLPNVYWLPQRDFNVLSVDYRGYGASSGKPTIEGLIIDARSAIEYAINEFSDMPIAVFGQSIGGAAAIGAIEPYKEQIGALITEGAFSSYEAIAKEVAKRSLLGYLALPFLGEIADKRYDPIENIAALEGLPIWIIHGDRDLVVSVGHARELFDRAKEPKELNIVFNGGHIGSFAVNREKRERFAEAIDALFNRRDLKAGEKR